MSPGTSFLILVAAALLAGCDRLPRAEPGTQPGPPGVPAGSFTLVPDSAWISVDRPTMVGFFPVKSNAEIDADDDLATVLDDFSYHLGTAIDSLQAQGFVVTMEPGDTIWLRSSTDRWRFVRPADSAIVGYYLTAPDKRSRVIYGVRTSQDLIQFAREFRRGVPPITP